MRDTRASLTCGSGNSPVRTVVGLAEEEEGAGAWVVAMVLVVMAMGPGGRRGLLSHTSAQTL